MKKFLEDLKKELNNRHLQEQDINEILQDHEEMYQNAMLEGLSEEEILKRFGNPKDLAEQLASFSSKESEPYTLPNGYKLWNSYSSFDKNMSFKVSLVDEDLKIVANDSDELKIYYQGNEDISKYSLNCDNHSFSLEAPKKHGFLFTKSHLEDMSFIIELPRTLLMKSINLTVVSSDIEIQGIKTMTSFITTTSGDVAINNCNLGDSKWNTVSGDIAITDIRAEQINSSQVSGDLSIKNSFVSKYLKMNTVSGDIELNDVVCQECSFQTVNGDLNATEFYPEKISYKSVSGDMNIHNKNKNPILITKNSLSGDINIH